MILEIKDLHKSFGEKEVLHGISFQAESGRALGFLGRNGAGKTTTIRILMDVFHADRGEILLDGQKFVPQKYRIGYLPEERGLYPKRRVMDQMIFLASLRGISEKQARQNAKRWLERLEVEAYADKKLETLSKGNQQKVQLASTLVHDPQIVILDEPFSGLDPVNSQILKDVINQLIAQDRMVLFSSHQMSYVEEFCDQIVIIHNGSVALKGELKQIKKEYGRNRLILAVEDLAPAQLAERIPGILEGTASVSAVKRDFVILELSEGEDMRRQTMRRLIDSGLSVELFGSYEPSLNDIFVARVGAENNQPQEGEDQ